MVPGDTTSGPDGSVVAPAIAARRKEFLNLLAEEVAEGPVGDDLGVPVEETERSNDLLTAVGDGTSDKADGDDDQDSVRSADGAEADDGGLPPSCDGGEDGDDRGGQSGEDERDCDDASAQSGEDAWDDDKGIGQSGEDGEGDGGAVGNRARIERVTMTASSRRGRVERTMGMGRDGLMRAWRMVVVPTTASSEVLS